MAEIRTFEWEMALRAAADRALFEEEEAFDALLTDEKGSAVMPRALARAERREKRRKSTVRRAIIKAAAGIAAAALLFSAAVAAAPVTMKCREMIMNRFEE